MPNAKSPAPLNEKAWKNKRVLILGLGQYPQGSGVTAALLFARLGARVMVTDLKTKKELAKNVKRLARFKNVRFALGGHRLEDVRRAELIVANPRVRPASKELKLARKLGIPATSDVSLFLDRCPAPVIAVTGTRGKSTTSALIASIIRASGKKVWLGGNILVSPLTFLSKVRLDHAVVLELSSWQCESLSKSKAPQVAVVTNLMRDHLNTYDGMDDYAEAKAQIFRHQTTQDTVVLNEDDVYGRRWMAEAPSRALTFSWRKGAAHVKGSYLVLRTGKKDVRLMRLDRLPLLGRHNVMNALAASLASHAAGATTVGIRRGLSRFKPLANRLEPIRTVRGVTYVNDTCATTPDGTIAAIEALTTNHRHIWLIAGGADKELEYGELAKIVKKYRPHVHVLLLPGDASLKIDRELIRIRAHLHPVKDLAEAVLVAAEHAVRGDAVVLSPGAASFNQFANEFERGEAFKKLVRVLLKKSVLV